MKQGQTLQLTLQKLIYDKVLKIEALKGKSSLYDGECFYHDFDESGSGITKMWGCTNRRFILLECTQPIWQDIEQDSESVEAITPDS